MRCPHCGSEVNAVEPPPEPPMGTWVRDRFGGVAQRHEDAEGNIGWSTPGMYAFGKWDAMWQARGPLVECGPWGQ